ncbi:MAG TPA: hypothetical protein VFN18_05735 [Solirubrobacterales bacterium]|nr:hypothetical protein [Solirubrobacterales bacterium]
MVFVTLIAGQMGLVVSHFIAGSYPLFVPMEKDQNYLNLPDKSILFYGNRGMISRWFPSTSWCGPNPNRLPKRRLRRRLRPSPAPSS